MMMSLLPGVFSNEPLQRPVFEVFLNSLPESIVRAKGILHLSDQPERLTVFQMVDKRWNLTPDRSWDEEKLHSKIVWIDLKEQFEQEEILSSLETCKYK